MFQHMLENSNIRSLSLCLSICNKMPGDSVEQVVRIEVESVWPYGRVLVLVASGKRDEVRCRRGCGGREGEISRESERTGEEKQRL